MCVREPPLVDPLNKSNNNNIMLTPLYCTPSTKFNNDLHTVPSVPLKLMYYVHVHVYALYLLDY